MRFVSAASLFDGHDAAINMIRRLLQAQGAEVVHLGHNRSVEDIVRAAIQEDADGIAVSSYQGGHNEYFAYMVDMLRELNASHIRVIVGGGGTISPDEIAALEAYGVEKIYTPEDGRRLGLNGMIDDVFARVRAAQRPAYAFGPLNARDHAHIARSITALEGGHGDERAAEQMRQALAKAKRSAPVIGITGTGGAGKSSVTDELLLRFVRAFPDRQIAVVAMDPTRRRSGGALLGDRIRMNSLSAPTVFMRSLATRREHLATSAVLQDVINLCSHAGFDLVIVETAGIGQTDSEIVDLVDFPMYVMTSEYGAASQLEKIDMLDFAELIVLNKFDKRGAEDALRDVRKQWKRNRTAFKLKDDECRSIRPSPATSTIRESTGCSGPCWPAWRARASASSTGPPTPAGQWRSARPSFARAIRSFPARAGAIWPRSPSGGRRARERIEAGRSGALRARRSMKRCRERCTIRSCQRRWSPIRARSPRAPATPRAWPCAAPTTRPSTRSGPRAWGCSNPGRHARAADHRRQLSYTKCAARRWRAATTSSRCRTRRCRRSRRRRTRAGASC